MSGKREVRTPIDCSSKSPARDHLILFALILPRRLPSTNLASDIGGNEPTSSDLY